MSKSLGNGIDPLEVIDQYGADALRFMLVTGNSPGNDMRFYPWKELKQLETLQINYGMHQDLYMMNIDKEIMNG